MKRAGMVPLQTKLGCRRRSATLLHLLSDGEVWPASLLLAGTFGADDRKARAALRVLVSEVRKKLAGTGVWIESVWKVGYRLTGREALLGLLAGARGA